MNKKHKHAALIKARADGAEIEQKLDGEDWEYVPSPSWSDDLDYRIKRPRWQQDLIDAVKAGKVVELKNMHGDWVSSDLSTQGEKYIFGYLTQDRYRIKPAEKVVRWQWVYKDNNGYWLGTGFYTEAEAKTEGRSVISKAEWTRMEFDE